MVLTLDKVVIETAERVGDRNRERLPEIQRYVQSTVTQLTQMLRKGSVYQTTTVSVTNGEAFLPANVGAVIKIYNGSTFFEVVDNDEYRRREANETILPTVMVIEDVPYWRMTFLNFATSSTTVTIDYLITTTNPAIIPEYYFELLVTGAETKYHLRRSPREKYQDVDSEFTKLKNQFNENQSYNDHKILRMKSLTEIYLTDPNNSMLLNSSNDYIVPGGMY